MKKLRASNGPDTAQLIKQGAWDEMSKFRFFEGAGPDSEEGRKTKHTVTGSYQYRIKGLLIESWNKNLGFELV